MPELNLTEFELRALDAPVNVADGHARQNLTASQAKIVGRMPELFSTAADSRFETLERRAQRSFMNALGQVSAPVEADRMLSLYSSSVGIDLVARCLAANSAVVGLVHPTFDSIPDLLKSRGLDLVPLTEEALAEVRLPAELQRGDCVFVTTPNNPTGVYLGPAQLEGLAQECRDRGLTLVLDTSFRGFEKRAQYDCYEILDRCGGNYVVIEDTGKLWPLLELKIGFLGIGQACELPLKKAASDLLLSVSPFVLALVDEFAADYSGGGDHELHDLIRNNRLRLEQEVQECAGLSIPDQDARVSVARVLVAGSAASTLGAALASTGVHTLACGPFHWAAPDKGEGFLRLALARNPDALARAATTLVEVAELVLGSDDADLKSGQPAASR